MQLQCNAKINQGSTPTIPIKIFIDGKSLDITKVDNIIFSLMCDNSLIVKTYPTEIGILDNTFQLLLTQSETEMLKSETQIEAQVCYIGGAVDKSTRGLIKARLSQYTKIISDNMGGIDEQQINLRLEQPKVVILESGATFTPIPTTPEVNKLRLEWVNDKDLPNPTTVDIIAPVGEKGERGLDGERGLNGEQGEQGIQGLKGEKGADGYTPIKGVDYFTVADKTELETNIKSDLVPLIPTKNSQLANDSNFDTVDSVEAKLSTKVDKIEGKQLSANDYTDIEKAKLESLSNYDDTSILRDIANVDAKAETKVDKVEGKQLSTNDYTKMDRDKLIAIDLSKFYKKEEIDTSLKPLIKDLTAVYHASSGIVDIVCSRFDGSTFTTSIDLPLELIVENGFYDEVTKEIVLVLVNKQEIRIPAHSLVNEYFADNTSLSIININGKLTFKVKEKGIGLGELADSIATSLDKANTAIQAIPNEYVTDTEMQEYAQRKGVYSDVSLNKEHLPQLKIWSGNIVDYELLDALERATYILAIVEGVV